MTHRPLGSTGVSVSAIGFGGWAIGGAWGAADDNTSRAALRRAVELGVSFFDTADVYGEGRSERLLGELKREHPHLFIATKAGRGLSPHVAAGYTRANIERFIDGSLQRLGVERLDLLQLHCPPDETYRSGQLFELMHALQPSGKVRFWGVSIETVDQGLLCLGEPLVRALQVIYNPLRQRPAETLLPRARERGVAVIARLPLASGLVTDSMTRQRAESLPADDHRNFNRTGAFFDAGETWSGLGGHLDLAFEAVGRLRKLYPSHRSLVELALRWCLSNPAVSVVIPGARTPAQVESHVAAADLPPLEPDLLSAVERVYQKHVAPVVHHRW